MRAPAHRCTRRSMLMPMADSHRHPVFARAYAWLSQRMEPELAPHRRRLLAGLTGRVVELGAGNGLNFAHYPASVTQVLAVEPEPHLRGLAETAAREARVHVVVVDGDGSRLPVADASVAAAVTSLVLCSVPDPAAALAEIRRVLRPGGQLRFFEHIRADNPVLDRVQRSLDATIWPRIAGGCHTNRDTIGAIETAGFRIDRVARFMFPDVRVALPTSPHVLGTATSSAVGSPTPFVDIERG